MKGRQSGQISENSSRIARNTLALYFRMFLLMAIGLFTARVVLNSLGVEDKGVYETVGSFVSMMAIITSSLSTAISRFLTVEIGRSDMDSLGRVFATAVTIMLLVSAAVLMIAEPIGLWYMDNVMKLPEGRLSAARWVFQFSLLTFVINLLSVPYNATIIAHERMSAFAVIGVVEGLLKLAVAILLMITESDRLVIYAAMMCAVAVLVRFLYAAYCRHFFEESRVRAGFDRTYFRKMFGFAGWHGLSYGVYLVNTQGITLLVNYFFGVVFNTMRGIALNVESMVKQFVTNVLTAMNPQITKSYVSDNKEYAFALACKGSKYAFLIIFTLAVPFLFEAEALLELWLGRIVPDGTALFTRLTLAGLCLDLLMTSFSTLVQASGNIRRFYMVTSAVTLLIFPITWLAYRSGAPACSCYLVFIGVYVVNDIVKLGLLRRQIGFPPMMFVKEVLGKVVPAAVIALAVTFLVRRVFDPGLWRLLVSLAVGFVSTGVAAYFFSLSEGERSFVKSKLHLNKEFKFRMCETPFSRHGRDGASPSPEGRDLGKG